MMQQLLEYRRRARLAMAASQNGGFSLVELLVVITIIGILAGLISVATVNVVYSAKQVRIKAEIDQLDLALKAFKQRYGDYPPADVRVSDEFPNPRLRAFIARAFPRYNQQHLRRDLIAAGGDEDFANFANPARALVFWLSGFNPDATHPFANADGTPYEGPRQPLFDFDRARLIDLATDLPPEAHAPPGRLIYLPAGGKGTPYLYMDYRFYGTLAASRVYTVDNTVVFSGPAGVSMATPYGLDVNNNGFYDPGIDTWANPDTFQIISAGQDGSWGCPSAEMESIALKLYPSGANYHATDNDNVTNFAPESSLEDAKL